MNGASKYTPLVSTMWNIGVSVELKLLIGRACYGEQGL